MGLFGRSSIKTTTNIKGDYIEYIVDFYNLKNFDSFKSKLIQDLIGSHNGYFIIDTTLAFGYSREDIDKNTADLFQYLDSKSIAYNKNTKITEANTTVLGIPIKLGKAAKVKNEIITFQAPANDYSDMAYIFRTFNILCYVFNQEVEVSKVYSIYEGSSPDAFNELYENPENLIAYQIYADIFFKRICITIHKENSTAIETLLQTL